MMCPELPEFDMLLGCCCCGCCCICWAFIIIELLAWAYIGDWGDIKPVGEPPNELTKTDVLGMEGNFIWGDDDDDVEDDEEPWLADNLRPWLRFGDETTICCFCCWRKCTFEVLGEVWFMDRLKFPCDDWRGEIFWCTMIWCCCCCCCCWGDVCWPINWDCCCFGWGGLMDICVWWDDTRWGEEWIICGKLPFMALALFPKE